MNRYYQIRFESDELCHYGIKGQKWGVRRFQNEDRTLTEAGKERYGRERRKLESEFNRLGRQEKVERLLRKSNDQKVKTIKERWDVVKRIDDLETGKEFNESAGDFIKQAKKYDQNSSSMQDKVKIGDHLRKLKPIVDSAKNIQPDVSAIKTIEEKESKMYSDLYKNKKLLKEISDEAYKDFSKAYKDEYSESEMQEDKEFWDSCVDYAAKHGGRYYESYVGDSILKAYYHSEKGKNYKKVVDSFIDAYQNTFEKAKRDADAYLGKRGNTVVRKHPTDRRWDITAAERFIAMTFSVAKMPNFSSVVNPDEGVSVSKDFYDKLIRCGLY